MEALKQLISLIIEDRQIAKGQKNDVGKLPGWVIELLIDNFADFVGNDPEMKWGYISMSEFEKIRKKVGEFQTTAAVFSAQANFMLLNVDVVVDNAKLIVESILHEIRHNNQFRRWKWDDKFRFEFAKGKKLPSGKDEDDLYDITWHEITQFWHKAYGYRNSPHEVDARQFATQNLSNAMQIISNDERALT